MKVFIIAEVGINHNGDIAIAKKLIDLAAESGCDIVKFQKRTVDKVYTKEYLDSYRESPWGKTQRAQKEGLEFNLIEYQEIDRYCKQKNISWFASAWDLDSQGFLQQFDLKYNKIASAMIIYKPFLEKVAEERKRTFISTGMCNLIDVNKAVDIFRNKRCPFELLHCISTYPMKPENANLNCIKTLQNLYKCKVGYSGHEVGLAISYAAVALGVSSLERHITLDRAMYGSDQAASLSPSGLRMLVGAVRKIEIALGNGEKRIIKKERIVAKKLRSHIGDIK